MGADLGAGPQGGGADAGGGRGSQLCSSESSWGRRAGAGTGAGVRARVGTRGWAGAGSIDMGSADSKLNFRKAVIQLTTKTQVRAGAQPLHPPARLGGRAVTGAGVNLAHWSVG